MACAGAKSSYTVRLLRGCGPICYLDYAKPESDNGIAMRHRRRGRRFSRTSSHVNAMLRNMASSLFLTERDAEHDENKPKVKGRIVTTLPKAKEVRSLVEKCITIARRSLKHAKRRNSSQPRPNAARTNGGSGETANDGGNGVTHGPRSWPLDAEPCSCWGTNRPSNSVRGDRPAVRRSRRRLHSRAEAGSTPTRRCRQASDSGTRRRARSRHRSQ